MCGNGGRCIAAFAKRIGVIDTRAEFLGADGPHEAYIYQTMVRLKMKDIGQIEKGDDFYYLNTGSPHYVKFVDDLHLLDVVSKGREIRYNDRFKTEGTNVNFVQMMNDHLEIRTYERGVEDETLACGTGITASSLAAAIHEKTDKNSYSIKAKGGNLSVSFEKQTGDRFSQVWLHGPAEFVFEGKITV